ncbi:hypothetical protein EWM64_g9763 [Hericium alpestre]|uniref:FAD-binding PCMH-type domain-containing protein n=1 Tax=Hericium alpestre TaxID=135208 RepID=A0A4Y9ZJ94_9AGAM|nr:hypothetical protein EWM64_g9763 [Hericium alpestre]
MASQRLLAFVSLLSTFVASSAQPASGGNSTLSACQSIAKTISSASAVYYPGSPNYTEDNAHWANSSSAASTCSVEPGTAEDVGAIIKGGGHATNPGFSSSTGVEIAMTRFSNVTYDASSQTADIGAGLVWDDVYAALEPHGVNVIGGRVSGVGVAGFTLGGGYSYKTNQYGLAVDNVVAYELVLPNGTVTTVTSDDEDLFWGLKGGFNNFVCLSPAWLQIRLTQCIQGIVTKFTFKTFSQGEIWGGLVTIPASGVDAATDAIANFHANVTDPKAAIVPAYVYSSGEVTMEITIFYDAPAQPSGIFDEFLAISGINRSVLKTQSYLSLVQSTAGLPGGSQTFFGAASFIDLPKYLLETVINETKFWGDYITPYSGVTILNIVEPFLPTIFSHGAPDSSAYPPDRSVTLLPVNLFFVWNNASQNDRMHDAMVQSQHQMTLVAVAEGQDVANAGIYPNYALYDAPLESLWGGNVPRLQSIAKQYDPTNVMSLTGGYKV